MYLCLVPGVPVQDSQGGTGFLQGKSGVCALESRDGSWRACGSVGRCRGCSPTSRTCGGELPRVPWGDCRVPLGTGWLGGGVQVSGDLDSENSGVLLKAVETRWDSRVVWDKMQSKIWGRERFFYRLFRLKIKH